ncbi:hypothetical protein M514_10336, partial [Trichuris suis]
MFDGANALAEDEDEGRSSKISYTKLRIEEAAAELDRMKMQFDQLMDQIGNIREEIQNLNNILIESCQQLEYQNVQICSLLSLVNSEQKSEEDKPVLCSE